MREKIAAAALVLTCLTGCSRHDAVGGTAPATGGGSAVARDEVGARWTVFHDPVEHAFSIEVPAGWTVEGGAQRMSAAEIRPWARAVSPDGAIELFVGDKDVPIFTPPNPTLEMGGFHQGSVYSPGFGQSFTVAVYQSGQTFAAGWGAQRIAVSCVNPQPLSSQALPQASRGMDAAYAAAGVQTSIEAGEASFACSYNGGPGAGYVFAATELTQTPGNALWNVKVFSGYASRFDRSAEAARLLSVMAGSFRVDPDWAARAAQTTAQVTRIVADTNNVVSRSIADRFHNQQAGQDRAAANFSQMQRGVATYNDPVDGPRELEDYEHQWRLPDGSHQGTHGSSPPVQGATELPRVRN
jgi:hypothetical protein